MKRLILITGIAVYTFFAAAMVLDASKSVKSAEQIRAETYSTVPIAETDNENAYVVKIIDNRIAVTNAETGKIIKKTDTLASILPKGDRKLLEKGINARNKHELMTILADYCS